MVPASTCKLGMAEFLISAQTLIHWEGLGKKTHYVCLNFLNRNMRITTRSVSVKTDESVCHDYNYC